MSTMMSVFLSHHVAESHWGANALVSFNTEGTLIHVTATDSLGNIQRAARRLDSQGIKQVTLIGSEWNQEAIWAFVQGYRNPKADNTVTWEPLNETDEVELQARIKTTNWVCDIINQ